jgi:hypothetical protein
VQKNVIAAMLSTRGIRPGENNWKLFARSAADGCILERARGAHDVAESLVGRESDGGPCAQEPEVEGELRDLARTVRQTGRLFEMRTFFAAGDEVVE